MFYRGKYLDHGLQKTSIIDFFEGFNLEFDTQELDFDALEKVEDEDEEESVLDGEEEGGRLGRGFGGRERESAQKMIQEKYGTGGLKDLMTFQEMEETVRTTLPFSIILLPFFSLDDFYDFL